MPSESAVCSGRGFDDPQYLVAYVVQGGGVDVDAIDAVCQSAEVEIVLQPKGEIIAVQFEPQASIDEVIMDAVNAHLAQRLGEFVQITRHPGRRDHDGVGCTEVEWLKGGAFAGPLV